MVAIGYSSLKRTLALAAVIIPSLSGCTSAIHTSQAELTTARTVVPKPKPVETAGAAMPSNSVATSGTPATTATAGKSTQPSIANQVTAATVAASVEYTANPKVVPGVADTQPLAAAYAEMPLTAEMLAIQSVVPTPRPRNEQAIASRPGIELAYISNTPMDSLSAFDTKATPAVIAAPQIEASANSPLKALISKYAKLYDVPEALVHRVVRRESNYNPRAYKAGNYGLMQIRFNTARSLGYDGTPTGLLDAETNLKYAVKYLRGAWLVADTNHDGAVRLYARGYYYDAKRKGLLNLMQ